MTGARVDPGERVVRAIRDAYPKPLTTRDTQRAVRSGIKRVREELAKAQDEGTIRLTERGWVAVPPDKIQMYARSA